MESCGKTRIVPGSQEVIGSIPICSTSIDKGFRDLFFGTLSFFTRFLPESYTSYVNILYTMLKNETIVHIKYITNVLVLQLIL
jgi:hypothetical protein